MRAALYLVCAGALACGGATDAAREAEPAPREKVVAEHDPSIHDRAEEEDDEGEEGFEVEGLQGHLDPLDIEAGIAPHQEGMSACFFDHAKKRTFLGGDIELAYTVGPDGAVKVVQVKQSSLGAWAVEKCLLELGRAMSFKKPRGKGDADFTIPLQFKPSRPTRWLTEEMAQTEVGEYTSELDECGNASNVRVTLYVGARGKVQSVGFASENGSLADEWSDCAAELVMGWQLTDPRGQVAKLQFVYNAR